MSKQIGSVFSNAGDTVRSGALNGETVGDLQGMGLPGADIAAQGAKPSLATGLARGALKGGLSNLGGQQSQQGGGMPVSFNVQGTQLPDSYYQALSPQQQRSRALFGQ